ncbi:MAG: homoserine dehydrogenase [bacterium]|nr:homoserine dehydrogenase [Gammaproteobacteria bacterium]HIL96485.1 homoserine dehydrogenase [Pseudomonadales bacterium]
MQQIGVGICGLGTVGSGAFNLITKNAEEITRKTGKRIVVAQVGCRRDHPDCDLTTTNVTRDIYDVVKNPDVDIVLELIGGTDVALDLVKQALANNKHVVTANKALIALHGEELFQLANQANLCLKFEAAIAGGVPIVKAIREGLAANRIEFLAGIINGTTNYILTEMETAGNRDFGEVLVEAQELGYAEADPTFDIEGIDAAHKLTILSSIAFGIPLRFDAMFMEGISGITVEDIKYASELGFRIKHLGITSKSPAGIELRVHPTLIKKSTMLAQVDGVMNAILVGTDVAGQTMYYGAGAGSGPTASSVVADVIDVLRSRGGNQIANLGFVPDSLQNLPIVDIEKIKSAYYLRLRALDKPGVMARISTILSQCNISIESLIQKDVKEGEVPIVIVTDRVVERSMNEAIVELAALDQVVGAVTRIRVETF